MADGRAETIDLEAEELGSFQDSIPLAALTGHMNKTLVGNEFQVGFKINALKVVLIDIIELADDAGLDDPGSFGDANDLEGTGTSDGLRLGGNGENLGLLGVALVQVTEVPFPNNNSDIRLDRRGWDRDLMEAAGIHCWTVGEIFRGSPRSSGRGDGVAASSTYKSVRCIAHSCSRWRVKSILKGFLRKPSILRCCEAA
jgi:hypothetical protein